jgi:hypothetical protein
MSSGRPRIAIYVVKRAVAYAQQHEPHSGAPCERCHGSHTALVRGLLMLIDCPAARDRCLGKGAA